MIKEEVEFLLDNCLSIFKKYNDERDLNTFMNFLHGVNLDLFAIVGLDKKLRKYVIEELNK